MSKVFMDAHKKLFIDLHTKVYSATPQFQAVYFLINKDKVVYVGKTVNLESRIRDHRRESPQGSKKKVFDDVRYITKISMHGNVGQWNLEECERAFIVLLDPPLNRVKNLYMSKEEAVLVIKRLTGLDWGEMHK